MANKFALTVEDQHNAISEVVVVEAESEEDAKRVFEDFELYEVKVNTIYDGSTMETVFAPSIEVAEQLAPKASGEYQDGIGDGNKVTSVDIEVTDVNELTGDSEEWTLDEYHADGEYRNRRRISR